MREYAKKGIGERGRNEQNRNSHDQGRVLLDPALPKSITCNQGSV